MALSLEGRRLVVVVGGGGVGKTTLAASLGMVSAGEGADTLVMTFDPSLRLKDALGVGEQAREREVRLDAGTPGRLDASLLDTQRTFDRLIRRYAPDDAAAERILSNRFYEHLAGNLSGILEYMAVERLFEVASEKRYDRVVLDTPPTRQALDFLQAPDRLIAFLDSGALRLALRPWFDDEGHLRGASWLGLLGRRLESFLDRIVGLGLLRDMAEFFQAFAPLYEGFRERAAEVQALLRSAETVFVLVSGPGGEQIPDTMFFARKLQESGCRLGPVVVNRIHPRTPAPGDATGRAEQAQRLMHWLGERDRGGVEHLGSLLADHPVIPVGLMPEAPEDLASLELLGRRLVEPDRSRS